jgi:hypothetical protein
MATSPRTRGTVPITHTATPETGRKEMVAVRASPGHSRLYGDRISKSTRARRAPPRLPDNLYGDSYDLVRAGPHRATTSGEGDDSSMVVLYTCQSVPEYLIEFDQ